MEQDYKVEHDWCGTWHVYNGYKTLVEPSDEYLKQRELEEQQRLEEEANRPPTEQEIQLQQNIDFDYRLSLLEMGLI